MCWFDLQPKKNNHKTNSVCHNLFVIDDTQQDMFDDGSDGEEQQEETEDFAWRKERYEREKFLKEQQVDNHETVETNLYDIINEGSSII